MRREGFSVWSVQGVLDETFALGPFTRQFARPAYSFGLLASLLFRRLFEIGTSLHFAEEAFALHFFLQCAQSLLNIVVADGYLNNGELSIEFLSAECPPCAVVAPRALIKARL